jgi:hypothetical protein
MESGQCIMLCAERSRRIDASQVWIEEESFMSSFFSFHATGQTVARSSMDEPRPKGGEWVLTLTVLSTTCTGSVVCVSIWRYSPRPAGATIRHHYGTWAAAASSTLRVRAVGGDHSSRSRRALALTAHFVYGTVGSAHSKVLRLLNGARSSAVLVPRKRKKSRTAVLQLHRPASSSAFRHTTDGFSR